MRKAKFTVAPILFFHISVATLKPRYLKRKTGEYSEQYCQEVKLVLKPKLRHGGERETNFPLLGHARS